MASGNTCAQTLLMLLSLQSTLLHVGGNHQDFLWGQRQPLVLNLLSKCLTLTCWESRISHQVILCCNKHTQRNSASNRGLGNSSCPKPILHPPSRRSYDFDVSVFLGRARPKLLFFLACPFFFAPSFIL